LYNMMEQLAITDQSLVHGTAGHAWCVQRPVQFTIVTSE
jgi:hypothetical protein